MKFRGKTPIDRETAMQLAREEIEIPEEKISDIICPLLDGDLDVFAYKNLMTGKLGPFHEIIREGRHFTIFHSMIDGELSEFDLAETVGMFAVKSKVADALIIAMYKFVKDGNGGYRWQEIKDDATDTASSVRTFVSASHIIESHVVAKTLPWANVFFDICGQTRIYTDVNELTEDYVTGNDFTGFSKTLIDYFGGPVYLENSRYSFIGSGTNLVDSLVTKQFDGGAGIFEFGEVPQMGNVSDFIMQGMTQKVEREWCPDITVAYMQRMADGRVVQRDFYAVRFLTNRGKPYLKLYEMQRVAGDYHGECLRIRPMFIFSQVGNELRCKKR